MPSEPYARGHLPLVLDGATGSELQRGGMSVTAPWWTSEALRDEERREVLRRLHRAYVAAGADVLTANTFRTNRRALERAGVPSGPAARYVAWAVADARTAARDAAANATRAAARDGTGGDPRDGATATRDATRPVLVAGSVAPVEDCYRPDLVPDDRTLLVEHDWHVAAMIDAGADLVLVETMNSIREAVIATRVAVRRGARTLVSFVCGDGARLLSGESVLEAARRVRDAGASTVLVNCSTPDRCVAALTTLARDCAVPLGCSPNLEDRSDLPENTPVDRYVPVRDGPDRFAELAAGWAERYRLAVVGGCCGSTPEHIAALVARLRPVGSPVRVEAGQPGSRT